MRSIASLFGLIAAFGACDSDARRSERTPHSLAAGTIATVAEKMEEPVAGGVHRRVATAHGALHLWTPRHYSDSADIVVYVHGNNVDVDDAWKQHQLAAQFAASGLDAMFIACEAPASPDEDVAWASLAELLGTTQRASGLTLPTGRVIVAGHEGAARTVLPWLAESQLDGLVMLDASGDLDRYTGWLRERRDRQLILVGHDPAELHARFPNVTVLDQMPELGQARGGRVVYVKSQLGHQALVTSGTVLPVVLQMAGDAGGVPVAQVP